MIAARLRRPFMPWQQHVADVGLELNPDGSLVYGEVDLVVGRQEGKTELKFVVAVTRLTAMVASHGPQIVTYTMQDRKKARTRLERVYAQRLRDAAGFREIPAQNRRRPSVQTEWRLGMNSGAETIQFGPASWLQIDTPSRTGGHGDTLDLGLIDEAFAHQDDTVELGMEPAMLTRPDAQLWVMSAAGDARSKYLWRKILRGRAMVEAGADSGVASFEWSADDDADPADPAVWAGCCPALGFTVTEAKLEALWRKALAGGPESVAAFRRSYMCQWPEVPVLTEDTRREWVIPQEVWAACASQTARITGGQTLALDVSPREGSVKVWASIVAVGNGVMDVVEHREGTDWLVARAKDLQETWGGEFAIAKDSPAWTLKEDLEAAGVSLKVLKVSENAQACGFLFDAAREGRFTHMDQPELNAAVAGAEKRTYSGDSWLWNRRTSQVDISPLVAGTLAWWVDSHGGASVYETRGLLTT